MENASKALLMAGGILIAIIIIALLVRTFSTINQFQMSNLSEEEQKKLIAFNEQYTKYLNQYVYGSEVASLINKYKNNGLVKVLPEDLPVPTGAGQDTQYYKCIGITFDDNTGKVTSITFKNIPLPSKVELD